jgi:hypothetical protein
MVDMGSFPGSNAGEVALRARFRGAFDLVD